jgi:hypothetical protein
MSPVLLTASTMIPPQSASASPMTVVQEDAGGGDCESEESVDMMIFAEAILLKRRIASHGIFGDSRPPLDKIFRLRKLCRESPLT